MDVADTASLQNTLDEAEHQLPEVRAEPREVVADKGYDSNKTMTEVEGRRLRSYVSEPNRRCRTWKRNPDARKPTYANRRRIRGNRGKRLLRQPGEKLERTFANLLVSGGLLRVHVRGQEVRYERGTDGTRASSLRGSGGKGDLNNRFDRMLGRPC